MFRLIVTFIRYFYCAAVAVTLILLSFPSTACCDVSPYKWLPEYVPESAMILKIHTPQNYRRIRYQDDSYAEWLRHLPLKKEGSKVYLGYAMKNIQLNHVAIIDIDQGKRELQKGIGFTYRLLAEYMYSLEMYQDLRYETEQGTQISFFWDLYGYKPTVIKNDYQWNWKRQSIKDYDRFQEFMWKYVKAGTYEGTFQKLERLKNFNDLRIGDLITRNGFDGCALLVIDMAVNPLDQTKVYLFAFNSVPNQDLQIMANLGDRELSPWYSFKKFNVKISTTEFVFQQSDAFRIWNKEPKAAPGLSPYYLEMPVKE
ncbi:MAG: DUF4846 domain-containing protein [Candidatus Wallbacteria bacterium]|nr:DUF4846 domain-containing protein [Candidatus Wallbacteria bacterium]